MLNELVGMYISNKYNILTDRILFTLSIDANDTSSFTLTDATNGLKLKNDLISFDYLLTKYTIWSQNGILDVAIKPDNESTNQLKTFAFTQKTEAQIIPAKYMQVDLAIEVTNSQEIEDDLFLAIEIFKVPQGKVQDLINTGKILCTALDNIDIQTLAIEKYLIYTNELLKALILANNGEIPGVPIEAGILPTAREPAPITKVCRRT